MTLQETLKEMNMNETVTVTTFGTLHNFSTAVKEYKVYELLTKLTKQSKQRQVIAICPNESLAGHKWKDIYLK